MSKAARAVRELAMQCLVVNVNLREPSAILSFCACMFADPDQRLPRLRTLGVLNHHTYPIAACNALSRLLSQAHGLQSLSLPAILCSSQTIEASELRLLRFDRSRLFSCRTYLPTCQCLLERFKQCAARCSRLPSHLLLDATTRYLS